jgi:hypothetical protein
LYSSISSGLDIASEGAGSDQPDKPAAAAAAAAASAAAAAADVDDDFDRTEATASITRTAKVLNQVNHNNGNPILWH